MLWDWMGGQCPGKQSEQGKNRMINFGISRGSSFLDFGGFVKGLIHLGGQLMLLKLLDIRILKGATMIVSLWGLKTFEMLAFLDLVIGCNLYIRSLVYYSVFFLFLFFMVGGDAGVKLCSVLSILFFFFSASKFKYVTLLLMILCQLS